MPVRGHGAQEEVSALAKMSGNELGEEPGWGRGRKTSMPVPQISVHTT